MNQLEIITLPTDPSRLAGLVEFLDTIGRSAICAPECTRFEIFAGAERDTVLVTVLWKSAADHQAAVQRPDVGAFFGGLEPFLAGAPRIEQFDAA